LGLYQLIDKPTGSQRATFFNELRLNLTCAIIFNDISDHLSMFALFEYNINMCNVKELTSS